MSSNNVRGTLKYVVRHVAKAFGLAAYEVEEVLFEEPNLSLVSAFLGADGPATLLVYEQPGVEGEGDEPPARQLYLATAESDRFVERGLLVVKLREEWGLGGGSEDRHLARGGDETCPLAGGGVDVCVDSGAAVVAVN